MIRNRTRACAKWYVTGSEITSTQNYIFMSFKTMCKATRESDDDMNRGKQQVFINVYITCIHIACVVCFL